MDTALAASTSPQLALAELLEEVKSSQIVIWRSDEAYRFGRIGKFDLSTDEHGDYLFISAGLQHTEVLHARQFSLHGYNLSATAGRAAAREYLRRKLRAANDSLERGERQAKPGSL